MKGSDGTYLVALKIYFSGWSRLDVLRTPFSTKESRCPVQPQNMPKHPSTPQFVEKWHHAWVHAATGIYVNMSRQYIRQHIHVHI